MTPAGTKCGWGGGVRNTGRLPVGGRIGGRVRVVVRMRGRVALPWYIRVWVVHHRRWRVVIVGNLGKLQRLRIKAGLESGMTVSMARKCREWVDGSR